jgi:hypothetical protein
MAEYSCVFTLTTPGGTITFNSGSGDEYVLNPEQCSGLDQAPLRTPSDDRPQTDGALVFNRKRKARFPVLAGILLNRTGTATARNTMENNLRTALESIEGANGTLAWTPTGGSARSLTVRSEIPLECPGGFVKSFMFGLIAANPVW